MLTPNVYRCRIAVFLPNSWRRRTAAIPETTSVSQQPINEDGVFKSKLLSISAVFVVFQTDRLLIELRNHSVSDRWRIGRSTMTSSPIGARRGLHGASDANFTATVAVSHSIDLTTAHTHTHKPTQSLPQTTSLVLVTVVDTKCVPFPTQGTD